MCREGAWEVADGIVQVRVFLVILEKGQGKYLIAAGKL